MNGSSECYKENTWSQPRYAWQGDGRFTVNPRLYSSHTKADNYVSNKDWKINF